MKSTQLILLLLIVVILIIVIILEKQLQENYRYVTAETVALRVNQAIELYNAYEKYKAIILSVIDRIKDKERLKKDICIWFKTNTLLVAIAYLIENEAKKVTKDKVKNGLLKLGKLLRKLNILVLALKSISSLIPLPSTVNKVIDINNIVFDFIKVKLSITC